MFGGGGIKHVIKSVLAYLVIMGLIATEKLPLQVHACQDIVLQAVCSAEPAEGLKIWGAKLFCDGHNLPPLLK